MGVNSVAGEGGGRFDDGRGSSSSPLPCMEDEEGFVVVES
jgi:hypothetical protein